MALMTKRVNVSLPDPVYADLKRLAEIRDQAPGTVAAIVLEIALREMRERGEMDKSSESE